MTDKEIYEVYKDYSIKNIYLYSDDMGCMDIVFPHNLVVDASITFIIDKNNTVKLSQILPEFVLKDVVQQIRDARDENNQYLWGI